MNAKPLFSVIIPIFNHWDLTRNCLASLQKHSADLDYEVIVVDNGSKDASACELAPLGQALFGERFTRLRFEENRNFGPACNAGAKAASAPLLFFLNNDTLLTPAWAPPLLQAFADKPDLGAAGPLLLYEDDTVQHLGVAVGLNRVRHLYKGFPKTHPVVKKGRDFQILTAAAFMIPASLFAEAKGFYEGFANGFEDVDLCLRLGAMGHTLRYVPESEVYHLESRTQGRKDNESHNSRLLRERQGNAMRPDCHIYGLRDGFVPFITDSPDISLRLTPEEELQLLKKNRHSLLSLYNATRANPFWIKGREVLAHMLEERGDKELALNLYIEIANILFSDDSAQRAADRFLQQAPNSLQGEQLAALAAKFRENRQNAELANFFLRHFSGHGDAFLDRLLDEYFSPILA